jgi:uncharacterized phage protein gp47/JayE
MIELRLRSMEQSIVHAFMEHAQDLGDQVDEAVKRVCTAENIQRILNDQTTSAIESAVRDEVQNFFRFGPGRSFIASSVRARLEEDLKERVNG